MAGATVLSGENITEALPLMPCLIQKLVGEGNSNNIPVSGVIYTDKQHVRIQAAPGHGELVVNSKGAVDNIFVTKENIVYQYLGDKTMRLKPVIDFEKGKMSLQEVENVDSAKVASLSEEVSVNLAMISHEIAYTYGMRMDIEFVFDPGTNTINIVQARPIPEGQRAGLTPSALRDDFIINQKPEKIDGHIITPEIMSAKIITNPEEILIREDISDALHTTLSNNNNYKAVIVSKSAPDTSHEAGFFSSKAVPVIFADNYELAKSWTQDLQNNNLVIDPQRGAIYKVDKHFSQDNLIAEGMFVSTLPPLVTASKKFIAEGPSRKESKIESSLIGDMLREAEKNPDATQKLFRFVKEEMNVNGTGKVINHTKLIEATNSLRNLPDSLEAYEQHKEALGNVLNFVTDIRNEQNINPATYQQMMVNGIELYQALKLLEERPEDKNIRLHYLNLHKKLDGIITYQSQDRFSSSVIKEINLHEERQTIKEDAKRLNIDLANINENAFLDLALNKKYLIRDDNREKWLSFCSEIAKNVQQTHALEALVKDLNELELLDYWMNINFIDAYDKDKETALTNLQVEYNESSEAIKAMLLTKPQIDKMEHQITKWSDPKNFQDLSQSLLGDNIHKIVEVLSSQNSNNLAKNISINQLHRLVDAIDLSMKQLQTSHLYSENNKAEQVENFRSMLNNLLRVLNSFADDSSRIRLLRNTIAKSSNNEQELQIPADFSVEKSDFFHQSYFVFEQRIPNNLAALHTLIHQGLLKGIGMKSSSLFSNMEHLTDDLQKLHKNIL